MDSLYELREHLENASVTNINTENDNDLWLEIFDFIDANEAKGALSQLAKKELHLLILRVKSRCGENTNWAFLDQYFTNNRQSPLEQFY